MSSKKSLDIYLVGVGGQGVLTIAEVLSTAAFDDGIPVNDFPTKGMAQRGGFVKVQLRFGHDDVGAGISEQGADIVASMEVSESLKAVRYLKKGGDFCIMGWKWEPAAVMLGKAEYPTAAKVAERIAAAEGNVSYFSRTDLPQHQGRTVRENIFLLGMMMKNSPLCDLIKAGSIEKTLANRWPKAAEANLFTLKAGMEAAVAHAASEISE
jgi:indolepyruvate ferredoxin oxidoreductase beta subunit